VAYVAALWCGMLLQWHGELNTILYRVAQKNRTSLSVDNSAMVSDRKTCDTSKVLKVFVIYSLQHSNTFDLSHVFLPLTTAELSAFKQVGFFGSVFLAHFVFSFFAPFLLRKVEHQHLMPNMLLNVDPNEAGWTTSLRGWD